MRKRWSLHSMPPRATQPVSGTPGMFSPWALSPAKSPTISAQRSKEDIAPWLASGPELTPAIKNLLCASGSSRGSLAPGTDQHSWAQARGGFGSRYTKTPWGQRNHPKQSILHHARQLQRRKEQKCLWNVSLMTWMWSFLPDSNILTHQQQRGGVPSLG